jgi:hypothetical protein
MRRPPYWPNKGSEPGRYPRNISRGRTVAEPEPIMLYNDAWQQILGETKHRPRTARDGVSVADRLCVCIMTGVPHPLARSPKSAIGPTTIIASLLTACRLLLAAARFPKKERLVWNVNDEDRTEPRGTRSHPRPF